MGIKQTPLHLIHPVHYNIFIPATVTHTQKLTYFGNGLGYLVFATFSEGTTIYLIIAGIRRPMDNGKSPMANNINNHEV